MLFDSRGTTTISKSIRVLDLALSVLTLSLSTISITNSLPHRLCAILDAKLLEDEMQASAKAKVVARELLSTARRRPRFGQGGDVENLVIRAKVRQRQRLEAEGIDRIQMLQEPHPLEAIDFDPDYDRASRADGNRDALFDGFVGFDKIMKQFQGYQQMASGLRRLQIDPRTHIPWAFVFKGPPGTGKT